MILRHTWRRCFAVCMGVLLGQASRAAASMYGEHVVELDSSNFEKLVVESASTWVVKFYAPWCGHCKSSAPAFSKAAKKLDGVAKLGVVNCDDNRDLASKYGVQGFPTIKIFKGEGRKARRPDDYSGERSASAIASHVKYVMSSFIVRVKSSGLEAFLRDERRLPHILLFTDKSSTAPLYKGLSAEFRNRASFGEVRKGDAGELLEKYEVTSFPRLVAFEVGDKDGSSPVLHNGGMDPDSLRGFFRKVTEGVTPDAEGTEKKEKVFTQPKAFKADVVSISSRNDYIELCGSRKDGRMCGLAFLPGGASHSLASQLLSVAEKYQYDNLAFALVDTSGSDGGGALAMKFGIEDAAMGGFVAVRARKNKFAIHDSNAGLSADSISSFLDQLLGGSARFKKLDGDLPEWNPAKRSDAETESSSDTSSRASSDESSGQCGRNPPPEGGDCLGGAGEEPKIEL